MKREERDVSDRKAGSVRASSTRGTKDRAELSADNQFPEEGDLSGLSTSVFP
jgi:hypothetical protein